MRTPSFFTAARSALLALLLSGWWACSPSTTADTAAPKADAPVSPAQTALLKPKLSADSLQSFTTAQNSTTPWAAQPSIRFEPAAQVPETEVALFIFPHKQHQELLGIGGAITDATAEVFATLPDQGQRELLDAYFSPKGLGYSLVRTTIHSSDFGTGSYTYIQEGDSSLQSFSVAHDTTHRIPMIRAAMQTAPDSLWIYASPWSPPAFMKDNNNMLRGGKLLPQYRDAWARYYVRFIQEYAKQGIPIQALTIQNEPMAVQRWESCIYTAEDERDFLKLHLGPTLAKNNLGHVRIIGWDHNRDLLPQRAATLLDDSVAASYLWGIGFHWYETWTGETPKFSNLDFVSNNYPDVKLIFTEGCNERFDPAKYQHWPLAERYGLSMINDFNAGTVAWTDWNMLLDQQGGPNHVGNFCFAPVHADTNTHKLTYTPSYYYIGHFSRFARPGARRIATASSRNSLQSTSFLNTDGSIATIVLNTTDAPIVYRLQVAGRQARVEIPPHAIQTLVY